MGELRHWVEYVVRENRWAKRWFGASIAIADDRPLNIANQILRDALPSGYNSDPESQCRGRAVQSLQR